MQLSNLYKINPALQRERGTDVNALWLPLLKLPEKRVLCLLIGDVALASIASEALDVVPTDIVRAYLRDNFTNDNINRQYTELSELFAADTQ